MLGTLNPMDTADAESLRSEDTANGSSQSGIASSSPGRSKRSASARKRRQPRVKYWTLPTVSSGTFDPRFLTERQALHYLAHRQRSDANPSANPDSEAEQMLEWSPLRLDHIKLQEMRSLRSEKQSSPASSVNGRPSILGAKAPGSSGSSDSSASTANARLTHSSPISAKSRAAETANALMPPSSPFPSSPVASVRRSGCQRAALPVPSPLQRELFPRKPNHRRSTDLPQTASTLAFERGLSVPEKENALHQSIVSSGPSRNEASLSLPQRPSESLPPQAIVWLEYHNRIRQLHLDALLECIALRRGLSLQSTEMQETRKLLLAQQ
jgi:hypothetical protein